MNNSIKIYPNPAKSIITISNEQLEINNISIIDILGKEIERINLGNNETYRNINISYLPNGIYLINVKFNDNSYTTKQFIVKH